MEFDDLGDLMAAALTRVVIDRNMKAVYRAMRLTERDMAATLHLIFERMTEETSAIKTRRSDKVHMNEAPTTGQDIGFIVAPEVVGCKTSYPD
jgi:hypothetical protein